jgi:hypothetical protein
MTGPHLIIEGCDASGKDGMIARLMDHYLDRFTLHERASTSLGGPVDNLSDWVDRDLTHLLIEQPSPYIYNRHPLISEFMYAPWRENRRGLRGRFHDSAWVESRSKALARHTILVICQPPFTEIDRIMNEQGREAHMPGVLENRFTIYRSYENFVWPGTTIRYNRNNSTFEQFIRTLDTILGPVSSGK